MGCGGSVGEGYGPMVVFNRMLDVQTISGRIEVAVPGEADHGLSCTQDPESGDQDGYGSVRPHYSRYSGGKILKRAHSRRGPARPTPQAVFSE